MAESKITILPYTHYEQGKDFCGPASLRILLSFFGKTYSEEELARLCGAKLEVGTEQTGLIAGAKAVGAHVFAKEHGTIEELEYFIKTEKLPVIVDWFDVDDGHYCVVVGMTEKDLILADPSKTEKERRISKEFFPKVWFGFIGDDNAIASWGWYMVATFDERKFNIAGTYY